MQTSKLNQKLASAYQNTLKYRNITHKSLFITFSGTPGSGKTTLAKKLTQDLQAQYVQHDEIRQMIKGMGYNPYPMNIVLISKLIIDGIMDSDPNKLVILDASLDRTWNIYFDHIKHLNVKSCIIRLSVAKSEIIKRLETRDGDRDHRHLKLIDTFIDQFEACKNAVKADIELKSDYDYKQVLDEVKHLYNLT